MNTDPSSDAPKTKTTCGQEYFLGRPEKGLARDLRAAQDSWDGFWYLLRNCRPVRYQLGLGALLAAGGLIAGFGPLNWVIFLLLVFWGWYAESQNTTQEAICDWIVENRFNLGIRRIKHLAAGGVFIVFLATVVIYPILIVYPQLGG